jgi:hypothetical protein
MLWSYRDTGAPPRQPASGIPVGPHVIAARAAAGAPQHGLIALLLRPEVPYLAVGSLAAFALLFAIATYIRRGRGRPS